MLDCEQLRVTLHEQHTVFTEVNMDAAHACISSLFVGIGTGPELEQNYNITSIQCGAPSTWSPLLPSSLPSFYFFWPCSTFFIRCLSESLKYVVFLFDSVSLLSG